MMDGLNVEGRIIINFRHADNTVLISDSVEKLQTVVNAVKVASEEKGLRTNEEKTESKVV